MTKLPLHRIRVLLAVAGSLFFLAQVGAQVVPTVSPNLTENLAVEPVPTLSTDLLAPQRPYFFDPTGASVFTNAFNPFVYSSVLGDAQAEMDTAIRDSTQAGQLNPYSLGLRGDLRLADSIGSRGATNTTSLVGSGNPATPGLGEGGSAQPSLSESDFDQTGPEGDYRSTWGAGLRQNAEAGESSWRVKSNAMARIGFSTNPDAQQDDAYRNDFQSAAVPIRDLSSGRGASSISSRMNDGREVAHSLMGSSPGSLSNGISNGGSSWHAGDPEFLHQSKAAGISGHPAGIPQVSAPQSAISLESLLLFSPKSYSQYSFGTIPFSFSTGDAELTFLHPNILRDSSSLRQEAANRSDFSARKVRPITASGGFAGLGLPQGLKTMPSNTSAFRSSIAVHHPAGRNSSLPSGHLHSDPSVWSSSNR